MSEEYDWESEQELECLVQSLEDAIDARNELKSAQDSYQGYSPGYHLRREIDAVKDAACEFGNRLGKVIDRRVAAKLNKEACSTSANIG